MFSAGIKDLNRRSSFLIAKQFPLIHNHSKQVDVSNSFEKNFGQNIKRIYKTDGVKNFTQATCICPSSYN